MHQFFIFLAQIAVIVIIQSLFEMLIDKDKKPYISQILTIACYAAALFMLVQLIFGELYPEILPLFNQLFQQETVSSF